MTSHFSRFCFNLFHIFRPGEFFCARLSMTQALKMVSGLSRMLISSSFLLPPKYYYLQHEKRSRKDKKKLHTDHRSRLNFIQFPCSCFRNSDSLPACGSTFYDKLQLFFWKIEYNYFFFVLMRHRSTTRKPQFHVTDDVPDFISPHVETSRDCTQNMFVHVEREHEKWYQKQWLS